MESLRVVRCEHPDGRRAFSAMAYELEMGDWDHMPNPYEDIDNLDCLRDEQVCAAFPHTLDAWFPEPLRAAMRSLGFRFVVLDVPHGKHMAGSYQAIFDRKDAIEVEEYLQ